MSCRSGRDLRFGVGMCVLSVRMILWTAEGQMCGFVTLEVLDAAVFHPELMQRKGCLTPGRCQDALVNASSSAHLGARD